MSATQETIAGFELPEGKSVADLDTWPPFVEWYLSDYGFAPEPNNLACREMFEAWLAGAYWQSQHSKSVKTK